MTENIEEIWKEYHTKLRSFIQNRVGNLSDADDILQDVFLSIHAKIGTLRESNRIQSWIYRITRNSIIDYFRTRRTFDELPETLPAPEQAAGRDTSNEIKSWLLPMIGNLPDTYRETLMLSEIEALPQKEVADRQQISLSGAKSRIQRGRAKIKEMLLECCHFEFDRLGSVTDYEMKRQTCDICKN